MKKLSILLFEYLFVLEILFEIKFLFGFFGVFVSSIMIDGSGALIFFFASLTELCGLFVFVDVFRVEVGGGGGSPWSIFGFSMVERR